MIKDNWTNNYKALTNF